MYCGLDFGTSNSTIGIIKDGEPYLIPLENKKPGLRSAIFLNDDKKCFSFGLQAIKEYLSYDEGRLLMSIKSVLGSSLMDDNTCVFNKMKPFTEILGYFFAEIKSRCEVQSNIELNSVILGRPVHFNDTDEYKDKKAENTLRSIAESVGFKNIKFLYEPIAAAKAYIHSNPIGKLAVIVDMGGGTSDFTILRIGKESDGTMNDIVATGGIHVGGTNIDRLISLSKVMPILGLGSEMISSSGQRLPVPSSAYHRLSTWHEIEHLYSYKDRRLISHIYATAIETNKINRLMNVLKDKDGHRLLESCEESKIHLSDAIQSIINMNFVEEDLNLPICRNELDQIIKNEIESLLDTLSNMNITAGIDPLKVDVVFFTGGTSKIDSIRERILSMYRNARPFKGDVFGSVGIGLTLAAKENFGN